MSEPYIGEIRMVGFNFAPRNWALCEGAILPIAQNQSMYSILGTTYGGDGRTSFALPDLRGRVPIGSGTDDFGNNYSQGAKAGEENHVLDISEMPGHSHQLVATSGAGDQTDASGRLLGDGGASHLYSNSNANLVDMNGSAVGHAGGGQGHNNMQPTIAVNFIIALIGLFPPRN